MAATASGVGRAIVDIIWCHYCSISTLVGVHGVKDRSTFRMATRKPVYLMLHREVTGISSTEN